MNKLEKNAKIVVENIKKISGDSPDIIIKDIKLNPKQLIYVIYSQAVADSDKINDFILRSITIDIKSQKKVAFDDLLKDFKNTIPHISMQTFDNYDKLFYFLYNGFCLILIDGYIEALTFETRANLHRAIEDTQTEPIIHGPKDGFVGDFYKNIGLIRKRLRDQSLWLEEFTIGRRSKTKVGVLYIKDIVEEELVNNIKKKIEKIDIDGIFDIGELKELIYKDTKTSFPIVLHTERPDRASMSLLEGKIVITIENSPVVIIIPTFLIDFFHTSDDYYQKPIHITFIRLIRIFCFFLAVIIPGFYIAILAFDREVIPPMLLVNIIAQREGIPFPIFLEIIILAFIFEILKESDIRLPVNVGGSMAILGALILGQAAVMAGVFSAIAIIVIAISAISSLVFQSVEIINTLRLWRFVFIFFGSLFGMTGIFVGGLLLTIQLCSIKSFGKPYLIPLAPFIKKDHQDAIYRTTTAKRVSRSKILTENNLVKQKEVT
jgi:spore germination protein KA